MLCASEGNQHKAAFYMNMNEDNQNINYEYMVENFKLFRIRPIQLPHTPTNLKLLINLKFI